MKKIFAFLLLILTLTVLGLLTVGAVDDSIEIPYAQNAPVIDGVLSEGEYPGEALVMNDTTAEAWVGSMTPETSTVWYLAWDDTGLYVFATVKDKTPVYRGTNSHWVGADCVEIGLNPGYVLKKSDDKGVFFSMGAMADGNVVVYRHNYDERILSSKVDGCSLGHTEGSSSYTVEVCIPWSLIFIEADCTKTDTHLDATHLVPEHQLVMDLVLATIDATDDNTVGTAYKCNDTDFITGEYLLAHLSKTESTDSEVVTDPSPVETNPAETLPSVESEPPETTPSLIIGTEPEASSDMELSSASEPGESATAAQTTELVSSSDTTSTGTSPEGCGSTATASSLCLLTVLVGLACVGARKHKEHP